MKLNFKKIDVIIIVILLVIAGFILFRGGYIPEPGKPTTPAIEIEHDDEANKLIVRSVSREVLWLDIEIQGQCDKTSLGPYVTPGNEITKCKGTIILTYKPTNEEIYSWTFSEKDILPSSVIGGNYRSVSPEDEGAHFNSIIIGEEFFREWWYYTVIFDEESDLAGWTLTISFNHMSRNDLFMLKPDILFVVLHSPDGKEYGGIIERSRPILGLLQEPSLKAASSANGFKVSFEDSYVQGKSPNWHIHIEGENIDNKANLKMDLQFFANSDPYWTHSSRLIDKSKGRISSYIFLGCDVEGTVSLDNVIFNVKGEGHHEHTWASGIMVKTIFKGWDWYNIKLDNGWTIYFNNYYVTTQIQGEKTYTTNPFSTLIITTDSGKTMTLLESLNVEIKNSDKIFLLLNIPKQTQITASPSITQPLLRTYQIELALNINSNITLNNIWKGIVHVGMKIGRSAIDGLITWSDDDGDHEIELNGIATTWNMRH